MAEGELEVSPVCVAVELAAPVAIFRTFLLKVGLLQSFEVFGAAALAIILPLLSQLVILRSREAIPMVLAVSRLTVATA